MSENTQQHTAGTLLTCARPQVYNTATHGFPELDVMAAGASGKPVRENKYLLENISVYKGDTDIISKNLTKKVIHSKSVENAGRADHGAHGG